MKQFKSIRPYPITLYKGEQQIIVHPEQVIELPEQFGLMYSGLLTPIYNHIQPTIVETVEEKIQEVETKEELDEVVQGVFVTKDEEKVETKSEESIEEKIEVVEEKRGRGRPKKV